jgi:pilus assembly protein CpaB
MINRRGTWLVLISLAMGGLAAWAANNWVNVRLSVADTNQYDIVIAAATAIPYGSKVESRHLRVMQVPAGSAPDEAFRRIEDVEGMVAVLSISRGEILMQDRFVSHESGSTLSALVGENMRAVTVRVDDVVGVAGFLLPGNRVDIVATRMEPGTRRATAETILRNIRVLAVDQSSATDSQEPVVVRAVTIELTPKQSEILVKSREEGRIQLTLRNPLDQSEETVAAEPPPPPAAPPPRPPVARAAPRPAPAPPRQPTVTVIRGTQVGTAPAGG